MTWWMGRAPGWVALRWFAVVTLGAAAYAAGNVVTSRPDFSDHTVVLASRIQLAGLMAELWAWFHVADHLTRRSPGPVERRLRIVFPAVGLLSLVPGVVYSGAIASHVFAPWSAEYREVVPTAFGAAVFAGGLAAAATVLGRFVRGWRRGIPHCGLHALAMGTLIALATNDALVAGSVLPFPYLLDVGILAPLGALAWSQTSRFVADARALVALRQQLEAEVERRTGELAQARDALFQAEKLAALGRFAAGVAHEVNNPAAVVASNLAYLSESAASRLAPEEREALSESQQSVRRIGALVRKLVDAGRLADGAPGGGACPLAPVVESLLAARPVDPGVSLSSRVPADLHVRAPRDRLEKILAALLSNACESIPAGRAGRVVIVARPANGGQVVIEVMDDGVGMAPAVLERAFDPFFTTRAVGYGAGLGLTVARALAEGMGGALVLESRPGAGTTARVLLSAAAAPGEP
jgi:signal transduction histidine kinase